MPRGINAARTARASLRVTRWFLAMLRNGRLPAGLLAVAVGSVLAVLVTDPHFAVRDVVVQGVVTVSGPSLAETTGVLGRSVFGGGCAAGRPSRSRASRQYGMWMFIPRHPTGS